ncbi:MAG: flagellar export chaperone FliS [Fimbriimonadia bacterium]
MTVVSGRQLAAYRKTAVETASPLDLILMLYDGALRFLERGRAAMERRDLSEQNESLTRAQAILTELAVCLNMEQGGEVAANLLGLYGYMSNRLVEANVSDDPKAVQEVARLLGELRESWATLAAQEKQRQDEVA